ncbi:MAG: DUF934 domain-containing protein [Paracoccaceae bacterium]
MTSSASTILVTDTGFGPDTWITGFATLDHATSSANDVPGLDLPPDADVTDLGPRLAHVQMIRIDFPSFADGRGFTLARLLRAQGYRGRLRACGHVIADQYAMARRSGFDEIEISADLATRQPESHWLDRADWQAHDYQARMRG